MFRVGIIFLLCSVLSAQAQGLTLPHQTGSEKIALLPFEQKGFSNDEVELLTNRFSDALARLGRYEILGREEMMRLLVDANFKNLESCNYSYCIADAGKVLGVPKVMHASVARRGKLYAIRIRLIKSENAEPIFDRRREFSGEFDQLVSDVLPEEARTASEHSVESGTKWYVVAAAIAITVGAIYSVYRAFRGAASESGDSGTQPSPQ